MPSSSASLAPSRSRSAAGAGEEHYPPPALGAERDPPLDRSRQEAIPRFLLLLLPFGKPAPLEELAHLATDRQRHARDVGFAKPRRRVEHRRPQGLIPCEHTVEHKHVQMDVEPAARREALHRGHRAAPPLAIPAPSREAS
jgi:hypothetical protein